LSLVLVACGERKPKGLYDVDDQGLSVDQQAILDRIDQLTAGKDRQDAEASKQFDAAIHELTLQGVSVETYLIEALVGHNDWAVRYGVIHVLDSIGTKACVPALITALSDEHALVSQKAMFTLRVLCQHREVPEVGAAIAEGALPPVPPRQTDDLRGDADLLIWEEWHELYRQQLRDAWQSWWDANRHKVTIE